MTDLSWILSRVGAIMFLFALIFLGFYLVDTYDKIIAHEECEFLSSRIANGFFNLNKIPNETIVDMYSVEVEIPKTLHGQPYKLVIRPSGLVEVKYVKGYRGNNYTCYSTFPPIYSNFKAYNLVQIEGDKTPDISDDAYCWSCNSQKLIPEKLMLIKFHNDTVKVVLKGW